MDTNSSDGRAQTAITAYAIAADLLAVVDQDNGFDRLCDALGRIAEFRNFIVYVFRADERPILFQTNLGLPWLQKSMANYINGLYQLDPFHKLTIEARSGLYRMSEIMPEAFLESEYFNHFYRFTSVIDELRFVISASPGNAIHIFVEREGAPGAFTSDEVEGFRAIEPLVRAFAVKHVAWHEKAGDPRIERRPAFDLRRQIQDMPPASLTAREVDTVELMLKGHSTKSLARLLGIDDGTAANHKRNIYAKLKVHSQAQLFDLFLRTLTEADA